MGSNPRIKGTGDGADYREFWGHFIKYERWS